jgi:hypothetical protein
MNLAEKSQQDADSVVSSVAAGLPFFRIRMPFLSKFIIPSRRTRVRPAAEPGQALPSRVIRTERDQARTGRGCEELGPVLFTYLPGALVFSRTQTTRASFELGPIQVALSLTRSGRSLYWDFLRGTTHFRAGPKKHLRVLEIA